MRRPADRRDRAHPAGATAGRRHRRRLLDHAGPRACVRSLGHHRAAPPAPGLRLGRGVDRGVVAAAAGTVADAAVARVRTLAGGLGINTDRCPWLVGTGPLFAVALACSRSEEHTSELQSLMRISYAVFCLKKKQETS